MPLSQEEITGIAELAKEEKPDFAKNENLKVLIDLGFVIRTPQLEEGFKSAYADEVIRKHDRDAYTNVEANVRESTGIDKLPNEMASDYVKRAFATYKTNTQAERTELAELRTKVASGNGTADDKALIKTLETQLKAKDKEVQKAKEDAAKEVTQYKVSGVKEAAISAIKPKLDPKLSPAIVQDIIDARSARFEKEYEARINEEGNVVYYKNNEPVIDPTTYKPRNAESLMDDLFKDYYKKDDKGNGGQGGAGSGKGGQGGQGGQGAQSDIVLPPHVKTKVQLTDFLKESGLGYETKEFTDAFSLLGKDLPLK